MRYRTIDPGVWRHPAFLRNPRTARDVFLYLFSAAADDEGRFKWDTYAVLEGAFPRSYPETAEDVEAALELLVAEGLVVRYGETGQYGFLTGWYEHQYVQRDRRQPSSLPEPPGVVICSWAQAETIRDAYAKEAGRSVQQVTFHEAADWWTGRQRNGDAASTDRSRPVNPPSTHRQRSVNGALTERYPEVEVEQEVEQESTTLAPADADAAPEKPAQVVPVKPKPRKRETPATEAAEEAPHEPAPHVRMAETIWQLYGQELPCPKGVVTACGQFRAAHGDRGEGLLLEAMRADPDGPQVPPGAKPEVHVADEVRKAKARDFEWDPARRKGGRAQARDKPALLDFPPPKPQPAVPTPRKLAGVDLAGVTHELGSD